MTNYKPRWQDLYFLFDCTSCCSLHSDKHIKLSSIINYSHFILDLCSLFLFLLCSFQFVAGQSILISVIVFFFSPNILFFNDTPQESRCFPVIVSKITKKERNDTVIGSHCLVTLSKAKEYFFSCGLLFSHQMRKMVCCWLVVGFHLLSANVQAQPSAWGFKRYW